MLYRHKKNIQRDKQKKQVIRKQEMLAMKKKEFNSENTS